MSAGLEMKTPLDEFFELDDAAAEMMQLAHTAATRRMRICKHAPTCPKCKTRQVQIIDCRMLAKWKCRECRHTWRHEPIISNVQGQGDGERSSSISPATWG